ncbi:MAG: hypothetical protein HPY66_2155 [Firmicutes bacterium]|nr:hypothetical protein [Bacillota bacterium]
MDRNAFNKYLSLSGISNVLPPEDMLLNLDCCVKTEGKAYLTNAGVLFFQMNR